MLGGAFCVTGLALKGAGLQPAAYFPVPVYPKPPALR